jgi:hypothetical protein
MKLIPSIHFNGPQHPNPRETGNRLKTFDLIM